MGCITKGQLRATGSFQTEDISELHIEVIANNHAKARMVSYIDYASALTFKGDETVTILAGEKVLFCGYITTSKCSVMGQYAIVSLEMISPSILLDDKKRKRSFQDTGLKISDIMKISASTDDRGDILFNAEDYNISMPIIQYQETDWEFIRRLTSRAGSVVYPEIKSILPRLYIGMPENGDIINFPEDNYTYGLSSDYYSRKSKGALSGKENYIYYEVKSYEDYDFGSMVTFLGRSLRVCRKETNLIRSEVIFTYRLGTESMVSLARYDNEMFAGMTILGKVLSTSNETLRLHLDIDEQQDEAKAYDYEWTPETGNTMYLMPKVGTKVSLYFKDESEESALAVNCIRENGTTCPQMSNTNERYLTTENNKQMFLKPESMGLASEETGMTLKMEDAAGISVGSSKEIMIAAAKSVQLKAKKIVVSTPSELKLIQG